MERFLLLMVSLFLPLAAQQAAAQAGDVTAGKAAYTKACGSCHGLDGAPKEAIAKMMKVEMRHLGSKEVQAKNDAGLRKDIVEGTGKMRPIKGLSDKQVNDVVAFLRSLATKQ
jgi:mono/diheme cytochrome c family protein